MAMKTSPIKSTLMAGFQRKIVWWTKGGHRTRWGMMLDTYTPVNQHKCAKTHRESRSCSHGFTMGDLMFTPRGTGFKSAAKSKEWKSQERLHISNVLRWSKSPSHLGMAQLRITTINSSLLLSKSANRAAGEPRYSISQCFTLCDVKSQLLRHLCSVQRGPLKRNMHSQYRFPTAK